jgi:hypothetical protein
VPTRGEDAVWVGLAAGAAVLAALALTVAAPLSHVLFQPAGIHFFPIWTKLVHPKPAQETRYLLAVVLTIGGAIGLARLRAPQRPLANAARRLVRPTALAAKVAVAVTAAWCFRRYESAGRTAGVGHFQVKDVAAGVAIAALISAVAIRRPGAVAEDRTPTTTRFVWPAIATGATACWLLPAIFREQNIGHALFVMWWHMQFVYGDFIATVGGRTPLVDYNAEYGSLLPLALEAPLKALGPSVGSFTCLMALLTGAALLAVERALALIARSERVALCLYLPFLATGFFTDYHSGTERFYFGDYFAVFPLRYLGPYLLLWLCVRHLRSLRPRGTTWLFLLGALATINDVEFGLPALAATGVALAAAAPRTTSARATLVPLGRALGIGAAAALLGVTAVLWLRTGHVIELGRMTAYARLFGSAGFGEVSTPTIGLHLVMYATFVALLVIAALRHRRDDPDRALTGALAFAGVFGLGAGSYYMGGSNASQLIGVFSAWALGAGLLALVAVRALAARARPTFAIAAALVTFGLMATALVQTPAPWTQARRIAARTPSNPYDRTAAAAFVRRTAAPGERVVVLEGLGQLVAVKAGVENVSPYSEIWTIWSHEQLDEIVAALRRARGTRFYLGRAGTDPGIPVALAAAGFKRIAYDAPSELTEWRL